MARTVDIDFTFDGAIDVSAALGALLEAGMRPSMEGEVAYLIDEDGMFDWKRLEDSRLNEVIFKMGESRWRDRVVGITLFFPEVDSGGDFLFHPGRTSISCVIGVNPKLLPGSSRFCDIGWYMARLIPLFESMGLSEVEARDSI
ncbi:hypothetical protein JIX56_19380 [Streptomyces sp. CA-210063]|uniref:hypothetical protein n=1 Tax=Streptomyces sp. CA-210063 TaxID=2801029 RepID=UPI00214B390C|nr:hypothetical protein [Streptomyces sp. CA-210063]UUU31891.1 hypothetical protein JIX56_19380 [Streptomyces sp. CA-210063]